jgi:hypothetical protein
MVGLEMTEKSSAIQKACLKTGKKKKSVHIIWKAAGKGSFQHAKGSPKLAYSHLTPC